MFVDQATCNALVCALVFSHLDYCNSLLVGAPLTTLNRPQRVQNAAARLVAGRTRVRSETSESIRKSLHWLPILERIDFKIAMLAFKALNKMAPGYLVELIELYQPPRRLRSVNKVLLRSTSSTRRLKKRYGERAFSHAAPRLWNSLPLDLRQSENLSQFARLLKLFLFDRAYRPYIV